MSGTTKSPVKKAAAKPPALAEVPAATEPEELPEELRLKLDIEQQKLEIATMQAQLSYLSGRISELVQENHALQTSED